MWEVCAHKRVCGFVPLGTAHAIMYTYAHTYTYIYGACAYLRMLAGGLVYKHAYYNNVGGRKVWAKWYAHASGSCFGSKWCCVRTRSHTLSRTCYQSIPIPWHIHILRCGWGRYVKTKRKCQSFAKGRRFMLGTIFIRCGKFTFTSVHNSLRLRRW